MNTIKFSPSEEETLTNRGYQLLSKIGEGAYAQVYLSSYKDSSYKLACKIVDIPKASATYVNKFLPRELNILMAIKSPHIVHIHSIFRRNHKYFIFMRYAENGDLMDWIIANGAVPDTQSKLWGKQIVLGMQYLHRNYIAHRDIKCENILITERNNIKLTDFGFSRYIIENDSTATFSETYCGSLLYVAPEIVKGVAYNPFKSDVWSLGVTIFTMLNCKVPFNETNPSLIYEMQMSQKYRFNGSVLADAKSLIRRLLQPEPKKRPSVDIILADNWFTIDSPMKEVKAGFRDYMTDKKSVKVDGMSVQPSKELTELTRTSLEENMKSDDWESDDKNDTAKDDEKIEEVRKEEEEEKEEEKEKEEVKEEVEKEDEKGEDNAIAPLSGIQIISKSNIDVQDLQPLLNHEEKEREIHCV